MTQRRATAPYFAGVIAETLLRAPYERQRRQIAKSDQRVTGAERALLAGLFATLLVLPGNYGATSRLDYADYPLSPPAKARLASAGSLVLAAAVWLFWRSHRNLGRN